MTSSQDATSMRDGERRMGTPWRAPPGRRTSAKGRAAERGLTLAIPEPPEHALERPRLLELLAAGTGYELTLVSAPAGTGKTVAVSSWARAEGPHAPLVWISVSRDGAADDAFAESRRDRAGAGGDPSLRRR